jgi:hypothetical protein
MVGVNKIKNLVAKHFEITGQISVDPLSGVVDVDGDVEPTGHLIKKLPVRFGHVSGSFWCNFNHLATLEGAPRSVGGIFNCANNRLTTLKGAPSSVGGHFWCYNNNLTSLEGAPSSVGSEFYLGYNRSLPLLRLLQYEDIDIRHAPPEVKQIILKYAGTGKKGMLGAGVELARAGFKDNARW